MLPVFLNMQNRLAVVVGGGQVGRRKAKTLLDAGAIVRLVCLEPCPVDFVSPTLEWLVESYQPEHLAGAVLVFAASTREINAQVVRDAQARGLWVNDAAEPEAGDFYLPAMLRRDNLVIAVSTGGASPSLGQGIRDWLEPQFDKAFGEWVALLAELRPIVQRRVHDPQQRRLILESLSQWDWLEHLRRQGKVPVRAAMLAQIEALAASCSPPL